jgi:hypothetical protein
MGKQGQITATPGGYNWMRSWPTQTSITPAWTGIQNFRELDAQIREWRLAADKVNGRVPLGVNALSRILARVDQAFSLEMSRGPVDPHETGVRYVGHRFVSGPGGVERQPIYSPTAWKIPVRRITSHYYHGWMVKRMAPGVWMVYNPTREAYYIEYGIHVSRRRVRRPIRKLALIKTLKYADRMGVGNRVWEMIFSPFRQHGTQQGRGSLVAGHAVQSESVMPFLGTGFSL